MSSWKKFWQDFFSLKGRLSCKRFNKHIVKIWLPFVVLWAMDFLIVDVFELSDILPNLASAIKWLRIIFSWIFIICLIGFAPRRLHDMGYSGWWTWLLVVIMFSGGSLAWIPMILFVLWLQLTDGTQGKNKYGDPPPDD